MLAEIENTRVIEMVHPDTLKFAPFNPANRTTSKAVTGLKKKIEQAGEIIVPLIVTFDNYVADGHRRLTVAKELGLDSVPIVRRNLNLADLWGILNGGNMSVSKKTWMQAVREGMPIECVPEAERNLISDLMRVTGRKLFERIADEGRGPSIVGVARYVARYCKDDTDKFAKELIVWFMECGTLRDARVAIQTGCPPEVIVSAVKEGRSIRQTWALSD